MHWYTFVFLCKKKYCCIFIYKPCRDCGDINHYEVLPQMVTSNASLGGYFSLVQQLGPLSNHVVNITKIRTCLTMKSILFRNISFIKCIKYQQYILLILCKFSDKATVQFSGLTTRILHSNPVTEMCIVLPNMLISGA